MFRPLASKFRGFLASITADHKEEESPKVEHRREVRQRRISKLEDMRKVAIIDGDDDLFRYADERLKLLKRLEQEAEVIRLGNRRTSDA